MTEFASRAFPITCLLCALALTLGQLGLAQDLDEDVAPQSGEFSLDCDLSSFTLKPRSERKDLNHMATLVANLLNSVTNDQKRSLNYCVGDEEMHSWTNVPGRRPGGVRLGSLGEEAQQHVWTALRSLLSEEGFATVELLATDIERASGVGTVEDYTVAVFGNPMIDSAWGLQFDGHHIALNFLVHGDDLLLAPMFLGSQPLTVNGSTPLEDESQWGRELFESLSEEEQAQATVEGLVRGDVRAGSGNGHLDRGKDFPFDEFENVGIPLSNLSDEQLEVAGDLIDVYLFYLPSPHAENIRDAIKPKLTTGFFTFSQRGERVYYRIYVPDAILIEYNEESRDHLHTVMRLLDPKNLNDYGPFAWNAARAVHTVHDHLLKRTH
ncbi:MAG: DUF3500 domain-containing protein [Gammaproteobacteria bacterium]|nr:DUF3500 domain-containing protein [Gammaproteobacteria bacterium]MYF37554.1 DUF3500 domain-containing protein [Gammaproteobacteria bacterium]